MSVIDTHAHVDFTDEVQNALPAFGSILILDSNGVDGLQSHPIADDKQKLTVQLPRTVFIRNLDQPGANPWQVVIRVNLLRINGLEVIIDDSYVINPR
jgi:translation elongation factor EF-G